VQWKLVELFARSRELLEQPFILSHSAPPHRFAVRVPATVILHHNLTASHIGVGLSVLGVVNQWSVTVLS
jgi:hypothetical protein